MGHALVAQQVLDVAARTHARCLLVGGRQSSTLWRALGAGYHLWMSSDDEHVETPAATGAARGRRPRRLRLTGDLLLIVGGLVLAYPFWSAAYAQVQQSRLDSAYREQSAAFVETESPASTSDRSRSLSDEQVLRRLAARFDRGLEPGDPIGRLRDPADRRRTASSSKGSADGWAWIPTATVRCCAAARYTTP